MATPAHEFPRFHLPARIRAAGTAAAGLPSAIALAERIAELPGIEAIENCDDTLPRQVAIYLHGAPSRRTICAPRPQLLCRVSAEGIVIHGLDNRAKHRVVMRGWGRLLEDRVLLFAPRDDAEVEACWSVVRLAYDSLNNPAASHSGTRNAAAPDMPKFSRTTLQ